jgi:hypothetical protein
MMYKTWGVINRQNLVCIKYLMFYLLAFVSNTKLRQLTRHTGNKREVDMEVFVVTKYYKIFKFLFYNRDLFLLVSIKKIKYKLRFKFSTERDT